MSRKPNFQQIENKDITKLKDLYIQSLDKTIRIPKNLRKD